MVLHPFFVPIYVVALMLFLNTIYLYYPMRLKVYLIWVVTLYSTVLPMLTVALLKRLQRLRGREIPKRYGMTVVMVVSACCFMLCAMTMMKAPSLVMFRKIAVAAALLLAVVSIIVRKVILKSRKKRGYVSPVKTKAKKAKKSND